MADLKTLIEEFSKVAEIAAEVLPTAGIAGGAVRIGQQLISIIEDLSHHVPDAQTGNQLADAHDKLMAAITVKSQDLSARLRGQ